MKNALIFSYSPLLIVILILPNDLFSQNVGIGTATPAAMLHIKGVTDTTQLLIEANVIQTKPFFKLRKSNGNDLMWIDSDDSSNVFIGREAGRVNTPLIGSGGYNNTFIGSSTGYANTTGNYNTASGSFSLYSTTTGKSNTALGAYSLYANSTGEENTATGYNALAANSTGSYNSSLGSGTLGLNFTGQLNTAIGWKSLRASNGSNNTGLGAASLYSNTTGNDNTAIGFGAVSSNSTGNRNTGVGRDAIIINTTGSNNTALGYSALTNNQAGDNNTAVGYNASINIIGVFSNSTALGANTQITASDQARIGNSNVSSIGGFANWTNISDARLKKDIREIMPDGSASVPGLPFIMKLRPVTYHLDMNAIASFLKTPDSLRMKVSEAVKGNMLQTGFVAQEVEKAAQDLGFDFSGVDKPKNQNDFYGLRYAEFVVPLVKAVQEQQSQIIQQQMQMKKMKGEIDILKEQNKVLIKLINLKN